MKPSPTEAPAPPLGSLREIQERFLAELRKGPEEEGGEEMPASGVFLEPPTQSALERWRIYREGYRIRLVEAIRNDYEALARIVGVHPFRALIERYLESHPPSSHDIGRCGDRLADFLATDPLSKSPFLPDLARFESALAASLVAADPEPVAPERLASLDPFELLDLPLALAPGVFVIASEWPVGDLWALRDKPDDQVSLEIFGRPSRLVVHRDGYAVRWREIDEAEANLLEGAGRSATLAELMDSGAFGPEEEAAPLLVSLYVRMIATAILRCPTMAAPPALPQPEENTP